MLIQQKPVTRSINEKDRTAVSNILNFGAHVHRHLDWRSPLDWIGKSPFEGLEINNRLISVLSCAPDIPQIGWIRVFACEMHNYHEKAWNLLWRRTADILPDHGIEVVAAIPTQKWFRDLLIHQKFEYLHNIITLIWDPGPFINPLDQTALFTIRQMTAQDLESVTRIDNLAFDPLWQHSREMIELAFKQAEIATIVEDESGPIGYQITTMTQYGFHLGRLAVLPACQRKGAGMGLVNDLQQKVAEAGLGRITVNTHDTNQRSIGLYIKAGFSRTRESYPVFQFKI